MTYQSRLLRRAFVAGMLIAGLAWSHDTRAADDLLQTIKQNKKVKVCLTDYPPLSGRNPTTNEWTGIAVDMIKDLAQKLNVSVEYVDTGWSGLVPSLQTGKCEISAAATYVTPERAQLVLFTDPVSIDGQAAYVASDSPYKTYADLDVAGKVIGVHAGSANEKYSKEVFKNATIKVLVTDRNQTPLLEVAAKRVDGAFVAVMATKNFLEKNKNVKLRQLGTELLYPSNIAWMVPKEANTLQAAINSWLAELKSSGRMAKIEAAHSQ